MWGGGAKQTLWFIYLQTRLKSQRLLDAPCRNEVSDYQLASNWRWKAAFWCPKINTFRRTPGHNDSCLLGDNSHLCKKTMLISLCKVFDLNFKGFVSQLQTIPPSWCNLSGRRWGGGSSQALHCCADMSCRYVCWRHACATMCFQLHDCKPEIYRARSGEFKDIFSSFVVWVLLLCAREQEWRNRKQEGKLGSASARSALQEEDLETGSASLPFHSSSCSPR